MSGDEGVDGETAQSVIVSLAPGPTPGVEYPLKVVYCGECSMPLEYCDYSGTTEACRKWAETSAPPEALAGLTLNEPEPEDKKHQKRGGKGVKAPVEKKKAPGIGKVTVQREPRGKKSVTVIKGLAANDIELKVAAKQFAQKFACGSSVTGADEIVIQGDVKDNLPVFIMNKWPKITEDLIEDLGDKKR